MTQQFSNPPHARRRGVIACVVANAVCSLVYLEPTLAQEQRQVTIDANRCLEIESPDERLACFETQVDEARSRESAAPASTAPASAASASAASASAAPASTAPATAGVPAPTSQQPVPTVDVADLPKQGTPADAPGESEWVGNITSLQQREPNQYLITLDSGQLWQQRTGQSYALRVGQRVRIYKTRFGLRLQADGVNGFIYVERIL